MGRKGEAWRWCKKGYGVTVGEPSGDLAGHVGGRCTPVHPEKELFKDDGPRKGPLAIRGVRGVQGLSGVGASGFGFVQSERKRPRKGGMHRAQLGV